MRTKPWLVLAALFAAAIPLAAHHGSGASYDLSHPVTLQGTVTEFQYANPHPQLFFDVTEASGEVTHWGGEFCPNPAQLIQGGWGKKRPEAALAAGTKITITLAPARAGAKVGAILKMGPTRALIYADPIEMSVLPDRIIQQIEWGWGTRVIWTDGRPPLMDPDLPVWWGYSTGRWDGDTFVVTTTGVDERTWVDQYGYPHSADMVLEERYRRTACDVLDLTMIINDPKSIHNRGQAS